MKIRHIAFDMSAFIWRALLAGKSLENGKEVEFEGKKVWVNGADHGYENTINMMLTVLDQYKLTPVNCTLVFEGMGSKSKRVLIYPEYKAGREHPPESLEQFQICRDELEKVWLSLGAAVMVQAYAEGDDTLAYIAQEAEEPTVIATYDNDLAALNGPNSRGVEIEVWINGMMGMNPYAVKHEIDFDCRHITAWKALIGDTSDKISGCVGFGPAAFKKFVAAYGLDGLEEFHQLCLASSLDPMHVLQGKEVEMICAQEEIVIRSFELARLRPEWVNTYQHPLEIKRGLVEYPPAQPDDRLAKWYAKTWLVTADTFDKAAAFLKSKLPETEFVGLDIETSTPDESDAWCEAAKVTVDVFGAELTGMSLTFGSNDQYTMYFSVDHADTDNVPSEKLCDLVDSLDRELVIQNVGFELVALFNAWGERLKDNGNKGYLKRALDTALEASYVDEDSKRGLKERSMAVLGYKQVTYDEVTKITGLPGTLPKGGRLVSETEEHTEKRSRELDTFVTLEDGSEVRAVEEYDAVVPATETRQYKMRELTGLHVLNYGADDTRCTVALHRHYKLVMQMEHTYEVYKEVELDAAYLHAQMFVTGADLSIERMNELEAEDTITFNKSWAVLRGYLIEKGWEGTVPPAYTKDITPAEVKTAYSIVTGQVLDTMVRTMSKLVIFIREVAGDPIFAEKLHRCITEETGPAEFTAFVQSCYSCEPIFNDGSPKQMQDLLYTTMALPIRVRNKPTDAMRAKGIREGSPKTDALAIAYAKRDATPEQLAVLDALQLMSMVGTRRSLYYDKYPYFPHWKDGKIHSSHNQCSTNTRRASSSAPNLQQQPKHPKIEGHAAKFREVMVPHEGFRIVVTDTGDVTFEGAVVVSMDFVSQELVVIAEYSQDPNMVACFVGDNKKDMHALTGLSIFNRVQKLSWSYEEFAAALEDKTNEKAKAVKEARTLGKKTNFTSEYGAMAPKLAATLLVSETDAQGYLDAREAAFPRAAEWKREVIAEAKQKGFVLTMLGARRHLRPLFESGDRWIASKAERQAVNFKVQSSSAEMTKLAEGRMWKAGIFDKYDARYIGPIHDETVSSVAIRDLLPFLTEAHECMVKPYANMSIPVRSSISFGPSFGVQIEVGEAPTAETVRKGLQDIYELLKSQGSDKIVYRSSVPTMPVIVDGREEQRRYSIQMGGGLHGMPSQEPDLREGERAMHTLTGQVYIVKEQI